MMTMNLDYDEEYLQKTIKDIDFRLGVLVQHHNRDGSTGGGPLLNKHKSYDMPLQMRENQKASSGNQGTSPFDQHKRSRSSYGCIKPDPMVTL